MPKAKIAGGKVTVADHGDEPARFGEEELRPLSPALDLPRRGGPVHGVPGGEPPPIEPLPTQ